MNSPSATLDQLTAVVADVCGTTCVAVWSCAFGQLELRSSRSITQQHINAANGVWHSSRPALQDGPVNYAGLTFVPIFNFQRDLVGLLLLPAPPPERPTATAYMEEMLAIIARHLEQQEPLPEPEIAVIPLYMVGEPGGIEALVRQAYDRTMFRFGWNVNLVATILGIPRATLANRLKAAGARRPHPSNKARRFRRGELTAADVDLAVRRLLWPQPGLPKGDKS